MRYIIAVSHRLSSKYLTPAPLSRGGVARAETLVAAAPPSLSIVLLVAAGGHLWSKPACQQQGRGGILSPRGEPLVMAVCHPRWHGIGSEGWELGRRP
jgi:hypothetical protein